MRNLSTFLARGVEGDTAVKDSGFTAASSGLHTHRSKGNMMNAIQTTIRGNVTHDPHYYEFDDGGRLCSFSVAVNDQYYEQDSGEWKERKTEFVKVQTRRASLARNVSKSVRRGIPVVVRGRIATSNWADREGVLRHELVLHAEAVGVDLTHGTVEYVKTARSMVNEHNGEQESLNDTHTTRVASATEDDLSPQWARGVGAESENAEEEDRVPVGA